jgi:hypothetical protein
VKAVEDFTIAADHYIYTNDMMLVWKLTEWLGMQTTKGAMTMLHAKLG